MIRACCCLYLTISFLASADWPFWRGPTGGGSQPDFDGELIHDPAAARQVWKSEWVPDSCKGGYASPVVVDGRVYLYYYTGDSKQTDRAAYDKLREGRDFRDEEHRLMLSSPAADEVILCLDAATGKTLWRFVSPSTGLNQQGSNKVGGHFSPGVADGRVLALGSSGILFCLDATSGKEVWRAPLEAFAKLRELRDRCVAESTMPPFSRARGFMPCSAPVVAEGVAVVSDHSAHVGFDLASGKRLWRVGGHARWDASPLVWRQGQRALILGIGNCIDPRSGAELWTLPEDQFSHHSGTPALEGDILVFAGSGRSPHGASGWRLSPQGGERLWRREPNESVSGNHTGPGIHRGVVYLHCPHAKGEQNQGYVLAVDAQTGEEVGRHDGIWGVKLTCSVTGMSDRILIVTVGDDLRMFQAAPDFRELGAAAGSKDPGLDLSGIYANSTTPALVGGAMFFHGKDAVYCYDLRAR